MRFTIMGWTVESADQARTLLVVAKLRGDDYAVEQCIAVIRKYEAA